MDSFTHTHFQNLNLNMSEYSSDSSYRAPAPRRISFAPTTTEITRLGNMGSTNLITHTHNSSPLVPRRTYEPVFANRREGSSQEHNGDGPAVDLGHHNKFALNITCNLLAPLQHWLDDRRQAKEEERRNVARSSYSGSRRGARSDTDSRITTRIEELPEDYTSHRSGTTRGTRTIRSRSEAPSRMSRRSGRSRAASEQSQPLSKRNVWLLDQASRSKRSSGRTAAPEGRSRRAPTEMESVRSKLSGLLSRL